MAEAKNRLTQLVYAVENGKRVTICRRGVPVIDLIPSKETRAEVRKFGTLQGRAEILDPNWDKGIQSPKELEAWFKGNF